MFGRFRRYRIFVAILVIPLLIIVFSGRRSQPEYKNRQNGLGTNTWGENDWRGADRLSEDQLAPRPNPVKDWLKWAKKSDKTVLVTGGAGSLGHTLIEELVRQRYAVHAADIVPRPVTLPASVVYHRVDVTGSGVHELLHWTQFDGIIHLAAVSLEQWCAPKYDQCEHVNVGGTGSLMASIQELITTSKDKSGLLGWKKGRSVPWILYASSTDVYGNGEQGTVDEGTATDPVTTIGKTKLAGEGLVRDLFAMLGQSSAAEMTNQTPKEGISTLRGAIVRFSDVYGYRRAINTPAAFIPRLLQHAISSLPIQFSSDVPPMDLLHVSDAIDGLMRIIERLQDPVAGTPSLETFQLVKGSKRWAPEEIVDVIRVELNTESPLRDIGDHKATLVGVSEYSNQHARDVLDWTPYTELANGLARATSDLARESAEYATTFLNNHCPLYATGDSAGIPALPEDERNLNLYKLHNCTVNIGFDHSGWLHHLKCEDGKHCIADDKRVVSYNWNQTVWIIKLAPNAPKLSNGRTLLKFWQENGMGYLGLRKDEVEKGGHVTWQLFHDDDPVPHIDTFEVEVSDESSALRIMIPGKEGKQVSAISNGEATEFKLEPVSYTGESHYDMRLAMLCCQSEGDWPLLLDDHESADIRFGDDGQIAFNSSRRLHLCERAHASRKYFADVADATEKGTFLSTTVKKTTHQPDNWALKALPACWNDCNSPTICMQTGSCRCVQADNCPRRRENPLIAIGNGLRPLSDKAESVLGEFGGYDKLLRHMVNKVDWRDLLLPEARDYIQAHPDFIKIHVVDGYPRQQEIESADCHKLADTHCFSADSIIYKAMRHLSVSPDDADLIVLPVYQHCTGADFILHEVWHYAATTIKGIDEQTKPVSMMMTHDWGICLAFTWEVWESREKNGEGVPKLYPDHILKNSLIWSVMGDWDTRCYRPSQDVVVPARTCNSYKLVERFPDVDHIQPARDRPQLINWSGTFWGTGKSERLRLTCHRGGVADEELHEGKGPQSVFYDWADYMTNLNSAVFCPQPKGIAGE